MSTIGMPLFDADTRKGHEGEKYFSEYGCKPTNTQGFLAICLSLFVIVISVSLAKRR